MGSTWHMNKSSGKGHSTQNKSQEGIFPSEEGNPVDLDNVDPENPKGNNIHEENDIIKAMLFGRIGCRPDIPSGTTPFPFPQSQPPPSPLTPLPSSSSPPFP